MSERQKPIEPIAADIAEATLHWGKKHGKAAEQMPHLTEAEVAEGYRLAQEHALVRRWKETKAQDQA